MGSGGALAQVVRVDYPTGATCTLDLVPPIRQYLPLRNQSPEYEWDIPLRNGIAQWEG